MASTGFTLCGTGANSDPGSGTAWTAATAITTSDDTRSLCSNLGTLGEQSQHLIGSNFGFAVPAGATIDGFESETEKSKNTSSGAVISDDEIILMSGGVTIGSAKTGANWTSVDVADVLGGAADTWGATLTPTIVNASDFSIRIRAIVSTGGTDRNARVDAVRGNVHYTPAAGGASVGKGLYESNLLSRMKLAA